MYVPLFVVARVQRVYDEHALPATRRRFPTFLLFWIGVFGAGRWSVDYRLSRKREPVVTPEPAHEVT